MSVERAGFYYGIAEARNETPPAPTINVEGEVVADEYSGENDGGAY